MNLSPILDITPLSNEFCFFDFPLKSSLLKLDYIGLKEYISEEISKLINIRASELTLQSELIHYCLYFQLKLKYYHSKRKFIINITFNTYFKIYNKINFNTYL